MNIEQIAQKVREEMSSAILPQVVGAYEEAFLRRCLSKLAEQDVEPVGYINAANIQHLERGVLQSNVRIKRNPERHTVPLYTETQYIAAQQRTAEACATLIASVNSNGSMRFTHRDEILEAMYNGEWREHL